MNKSEEELRLNSLNGMFGERNWNDQTGEGRDRKRRRARRYLEEVKENMWKYGVMAGEKAGGWGSKKQKEKKFIKVKNCIVIFFPTVQ